MHKRNYELKTGDCLNDEEYAILAFDVRVDDDTVMLLLPPEDELDAVIGTSKWMVRQATAEMYDRGGGGVEIVGPEDEKADGPKGEGGTACAGGARPAEAAPTCGGKLEW
jgi:nitrite reductase (NAD(P)H)